MPAPHPSSEIQNTASGSTGANAPIDERGLDRSCGGPRRNVQWIGLRARALAGWLATAALAAAVIGGALAGDWWWTQAAVMACGVVAVAQFAWMQRVHQHPLAAQFSRLCAVTAGTLLVLTLSVAAVGTQAGHLGQAIAMATSMWVVLVASILLALPLLSRAQPLMREFVLVAGVSTMAIALNLLFAAAFSMGDFALQTLALLVSLGAYAGLRHWLVNPMMAHERLTAEQMFEHLYRIAREAQVQPQNVGEQLIRLLREMFEPLDVQQVARQSSRARVADEGASLLVPVPRLTAAGAPTSIVLTFARRGRRLFTADDARLADRLVDQLNRAVAFDQAVERGRSEERVRIAQDLHDDIGARLLTLMYQAPTREMEDYVRHTLKDLKTLTRGLAASKHLLSHAVAEWKADITQRLSAVDCDLGWHFTYDRDFELSMVQWSALTRVLRELVSNTVAHAQATRVDIDAALERGVLTLSVVDNGVGRHPEGWSHGLGLGGVRKRVKQLGGEVQWRDQARQGIACHVVIGGLGASRADFE